MIRAVPRHGGKMMSVPREDGEASSRHDEEGSPVQAVEPASGTTEPEETGPSTSEPTTAEPVTEQTVTTGRTGGSTRRRRREHVQSPWALLLCLLGIAASAIIMAIGQWRAGALVFAGAVLAAGVLRAVLPNELAGLLAVRNRWVDAASMLILGTFMVVVVLTR